MDSHPLGAKVELLTHTHHYTGYVPNRGHRLADILNDSNSSIMELEDVLVCSQGVRPAELRAPHLLLQKREVLAAFLAGEHEAPTRRNNNRIERRRHGAIIILSGLMLSGVVHLPGRMQAEDFLTTNSLLSPFIALTSPTIHSSTFKLPAEQYEVAIVHRAWIEAIELAGELASSATA